MNHPLRTTLAATCLLATLGQAHATASSSANISNVIITLTDLDPADGITPSVSYTMYGTPYVVGNVETHGFDVQDHNYWHYGATQTGSLSGNVHDEFSTSSASVTGAATLAGFSAASASGYVGSDANTYGGYHAVSGGNQPANNVFSLSPHTEITITLVGTMSGVTTHGYNLDTNQMEQAISQMGVTMYIDDHTSESFSTSSTLALTAGYDVNDDGGVIGQSYNWSGSLSVHYRNVSDQALDGYMFANASVQGESTQWADGDGKGVTAVPEPETYAMLLGGLTLLGVVARRRKA